MRINKAAPGSILVVASARRIPGLIEAVEGPGRLVRATDELGEAMAKVAKGGRDLILLDLSVGQGDVGLSVLDACQLDAPNTSVVVFVEPSTPELVAEALGRGAYYAAVRPSCPEATGRLVEVILQASDAVSADRFRVAIESIGSASRIKHCVAHLLDWAAALTGASGAAFLRREPDGRFRGVTHLRAHPDQVRAAALLALQRDGLMRMRGTPGERRGLELGKKSKIGPALVWPLDTSSHPACVLAVLRAEGAAPFNDQEVDRLATLRRVAALTLDRLASQARVSVAVPVETKKTQTNTQTAPPSRGAGDIADYALQLQRPIHHLQTHLTEAVNVVRELDGSARAVIALQWARDGVIDVNAVMHELVLLGKGKSPEGVPADILVGMAIRLTSPPETVDFEMDLDPYRVQGDPLELANALHHLFANAVAAADDVIVVRTFRHDDFCHIVIKDDGEGMSAEVLAKAFVAGFSTSVGAAGQGLADAKRIIEASGGTINVTSKPHAGVRAEIALPLVS